MVGKPSWESYLGNQSLGSVRGKKGKVPDDTSTRNSHECVLSSMKVHASADSEASSATTLDPASLLLENVVDPPGSFVRLQLR